MLDRRPLHAHSDNPRDHQTRLVEPSGMDRVLGLAHDD